MDIIVFKLENDQDLVLAHRRAMQLAELCGLSLVTQTSFATAVSEVARFMIENRKDSVLSLSLDKSKGKRGLVCANIHSPFVQHIDIDSESFSYAKKLSSHFSIGDTYVSIGLDLPKAVLNQTFLDKCKQIFEASKGISPYEEVKRKNAELQLLANNLVESENRYQELTSSLPLMMFTIDATHQIVYANQGYLDFTNSTINGIKKENWLRWISTQDTGLNSTILKTKLERLQPFQLEVHLSTQQKKVWHLLSMTPQIDGAGNVTQWFGFIVSIDAQKLVEQTLRDNQELRRMTEAMEIREKQLDNTIAELNRSNQELARYAYVASHDLQEPIRKAQILADMIVEKYADRLPDAGLDLLSRLKRSSQRMHLVVKDLLDYSRINSGPIPLNEKIELSKIIELATANLEYLISEKEATVTTSVSHPIIGNASQLMLLFQNLIANAVKFTAPDTKPNVIINADILNKEQCDDLQLNSTRQWLRVQIIDNGIGFDEQFSERIFEAFQRLHSQKQYEGTGIGLSIVKKIVEIHGGFIKAQSSPGKGSIFVMYLPSEPIV